MKLIEYIKWAKQSFEREPATENLRFGQLALPAIQRDSAWKANQVVNLWDSVLRGLPIGTFMLQKRNDGGTGRKPTNDARIETLPEGWDLLDGQQRLRSLILGMYGPQLDEGGQDARCVWIDLTEVGQFNLVMTSSSQPFGYTENGYKLSPNARQAARKRYEATNTEIRLGNRIAYTHELFKNFIHPTTEFVRIIGDQDVSMPPEEHPKGWPPLPAKVNIATISAQPPFSFLPLNVLLTKWIEGPVKERTEAIKALIGNQNIELVIKILCRLENAEVGLIDASSITEDNDLQTRNNNLRLLYDRIGAGGTPLSTEDRLFSLYKSIREDFHNLVLEIIKQNGHVMDSSKIAVSAIRIANALKHAANNDAKHNEGNDVPDVTEFIRAMEVDGQDPLLEQLDKICPKVDARRQPFFLAFSSVFDALKYNHDDNRNGIPILTIWELPTQLIQVLLFWKIQRSIYFDNDSNDILKFSIAWLLASWNDDKGSRYCFECIRENPQISLRELFRLLQLRGDLTRTIISPDRMQKVLVTDPPSHIWQSIESRLIAKVKNGDSRTSDLIYKWWHGSERYLPWLQRSYLALAFPHFDPSADRQDDTPFDIDHMVPSNHWGFDWRDRYNRFELGPDLNHDQIDSLKWIRKNLGDSIGNKWLIDMSDNRSFQDISFHDKLRNLRDLANRGDVRYVTLLESRFECGVADAVWDGASQPEHWTVSRMSSFQTAVEKRAAWLYRKLYNDLGFSNWIEEVTSATIVG